MSQENVEIVRKPLRVRGRSSRTLDERLLVRFPRLAAAYIPRVARLIDKLPPRSRLRQALLRRSMRGAMDAWNRRDLDVVVLGQHPECEHRPPREFVEAGLWEPCYRGREGYRRLMVAFTPRARRRVRTHPAPRRPPSDARRAGAKSSHPALRTALVRRPAAGRNGGDGRPGKTPD